MQLADVRYGLFDDYWTDTELYLDLAADADIHIDIFLPEIEGRSAKRAFLFDGESCTAVDIARGGLVRIGPVIPHGGRGRIALLTAECETHAPGDLRMLGFVLADIRVGDASIKARLRVPAPVGDGAAGLDWMAEQRLVQAEFNEPFYLSQFDPAHRPKAPLLHYLIAGWRLGLDPAPGFSTEGYLRLHADVRQAGVSPFPHFVVTGRHEGRAVSPSDRSRPAQRGILVGSANAVAVDEAERIRPFFDVDFYRHQLGDAAPHVGDPVAHYCAGGWRRGLDPAAGFSTSWYLEANPDIAKAGMNPFLHYVVAGKAEGRFPRHPGGARAMRLRATMPLETTVRAWRQAPIPETSLTARGIAAALSAGLADAGRGLLIALCHDDYKRHPGGVQFCIEVEERLAAERGVLYLAVHPAQPLPRLAHAAETPDNPVCLTLAGRAIGACGMGDLIEAIRDIAAMAAEIRVVLHHLLGHMPEQIVALAEAAGRRDCHLWLHDFFTLCPSYALQRNDIAFCGAPPATSNACGLCLFGAERQAHRRRMAAFFEALDVHVLSPSVVTRDFWVAKSDAAAASVTVVPHVALGWSRRAVPMAGPAAGSPLRVAFLGTIAPIKGWPVFAELARRFGGSGDIEFLLFGVSPPPIPRLRHIPVHVTADTRMAMVEAVAAQQVDLVLHWAGWPETFSLSTHEALAGGAFVLTNPQSGNVAQAVRQTRRGLVLEDEEALMRCFVDGRAAQLAQEARRRRREESCRWTLSGMTVGQLFPAHVVPERPLAERLA